MKIIEDFFSTGSPGCNVRVVSTNANEASIVMTENLIARVHGQAKAVTVREAFYL
jgi:hypothetical protein